MFSWRHWQKRIATRQQLHLLLLSHVHLPQAWKIRSDLRLDSE
jgi:hypothetical protein